jgi:hypothetical protein
VILSLLVYRVSKIGSGNVSSSLLDSVTVLRKVVHLPPEECTLLVYACSSKHLLEGCSHDSIRVEANLSKSKHAILAFTISIETSDECMKSEASLDLLAVFILLHSSHNSCPLDISLLKWRHGVSNKIIDDSSLFLFNISCEMSEDVVLPVIE